MSAHTEALIAVATGKLTHTYQGLCPDSINGYDSRDSECPACRAIDAALSLPDPSAAPVDLREIECPPDPDAVDRALATEGVCAFCGGIVSDPLVRPSAAPVLWMHKDTFALALKAGSEWPVIRYQVRKLAEWDDKSDYIGLVATPPAPQQGEQG